MKIIEYILEKIVLILGFIFVVIPQIIVCYVLEFKDWLIDKILRGDNNV